ncbi:MAG: HD domain-containing protein [Nanohaloarchaea archaeon]|nr:HD domain-containing protein [Candidatus Nanohaloarchaea archaeon]
MDPKLQQLKDIAEKELAFCPAHDIDHVMRVYNLALTIADTEDADMDVVKAGALLHDIGGAKEHFDKTGQIDHAAEGAKIACQILKDLDYPKDKIKHIQECIKTHRFRSDSRPETIEAQIIFDADKLETVGAIGVARAFAWIGKNNAHIYKKVNIEEYIKENLGGKINGRIQDKSKHSVQINYETKEKFIADAIYTKKGKDIAKERLAFFKMFLDRMEKEIDGQL